MPPKFNPSPPATIESLPVEIIQMIYVCALEPNLARASPLIAKAVSEKMFYDIFLMHAFWYDPHGIITTGSQSSSTQGEQMAVNARSDPGALPDWYQQLSFDEQRRLQAQVTNCRWFTPSRFQEAIQSLFQWTYRSVTCHSINLDARPLSTPATVVQFWRESIWHVRPLPGQGEPHTMLGHEKLLRIPLIRLFNIPTKILRGPWDKDRIDLLRTLHLELLRLLWWRCTRSVAEQPQLPRPTLDKDECFQGMEDAIIEQQETALLHLLRFFELLGSTHDQAGQTYRPVLPESLYRSAILHHPADSTFLLPLIEASATSLPDIPEVHCWAAAARDRGDPLGVSVPEILELNHLRKETSLNYCQRILGHILVKLVHLLGSLGDRWRQRSRS
ncbi:hypothetical protein EYZ11_012524 [Aspergillus tanneri]|uniref:Uncharacterized protein n=1 Tax=Aspergillus tanneri TaxID=1220188 RepID=A0A4S3J015_9EURO|nr:uncharacterized protein ATNIH1004_011744 [Aspergillus tanneri]KAA8641608.1 hypothetical protein ATNIH1004_011744 [Aspergillus tanneri]THC88029.1 hypothetical protein EYZ11_012524 [Aspergillus tanneri]